MLVHSGPRSRHGTTCDRLPRNSRLSDRLRLNWVETSSPGTVALPPPAAPASSRRAESRERAPLIVVDAGHGGPDRGMRGPIGSRRQIEEADITLAVARLLRAELKERGAQVIMTRSTDTLIALRDRGRIANKANADLFLSIHVNAANPRWPNPRGARGVETYFLSDAKTEDERRVAEMENDAQKYDVGVDAEPGDPFSFMIADMEQNEYLRESSELAAIIQRGLSSMHPGGDRGVKQAGFAVLVFASAAMRQ